MRSLRPPNGMACAPDFLPPEAGADRLPAGVVQLAGPLAETMARLALAGVEPALTLDDWPFVLSCSRREVERMKSAGRLPAPDFHVGKLPRWTAATVRSFLTSGGRGVL